MFIDFLKDKEQQTVFTDIKWYVDNQKKIKDWLEEFKICMGENM